ncbi:MAG: GNAT family N-acetyltransferase [Rhodobacteraceae bacterium]|nr:GNAT family N-acetyltransferase [Paracoccaceae bacterium]
MPRLGETMQEARYLRNLITRGWITVARQKGRVVGFLVRDGAEIHALYLSQRMRRQGIGKALLDHAKRQQTQLALWTYEANKPAQLFYLREGFHEIARSDGADNDEGLPDIRYEWRMSNG